MTELNMFQLSGFGGFLILVLDIWAIMAVVNSTSTTAKKVIWTLTIMFLPILGFLLWLLFGPRAASNPA